MSSAQFCKMGGLKGLTRIIISYMRSLAGRNSLPRNGCGDEAIRLLFALSRLCLLLTTVKSLNGLNMNSPQLRVESEVYIQPQVVEPFLQIFLYKPMPHSVQPYPGLGLASILNRQVIWRLFIFNPFRIGLLSKHVILPPHGIIPLSFTFQDFAKIYHL